MQAQTFGIAQTSGGAGATYSTKEINIDSSPDAVYTVYATYPTDTTAYSSIRWYVYGGIEKVSEDATHLTFRAASGTTYNDKYSRYAYGRIELNATLSDQTVADCECATMCNPTRTADLYIYKRFDFSANNIIGPDCVLPGDSVTFSVEPWLTLYPNLQLDTAAYFWNIPTSLQASPLYYSADKSSVTFVVSNNIENQTISCSIGRLNYADGQTPLTKSLQNDVADPIVTLGGVPFDPETHSVCLPFGVDSVDLVVTNASTELQYEWNLRAWNYRDLSNNGSSLRVLPTDDILNFKLTIQNGCSNKEYYYEINRSLSSANAIYLNDTTEHSLCLNPNSNVLLSLAGVNNVTEFNWGFESPNWSVLKAYPHQASISTGSTSTTIYVSTAFCGNDTISIVADVKPLTPTINYSGSTCLSDSVQSISLSVNEVDNADYYSWIVPNGWSISTQTPDSTIVTLTHNGVAGQVLVKAVGCAESAYSSIYFSMAYAAPEVEIDGCVSLNSGYASTITLNADDANKRYNWSVPSSVGQIVSSDAHASTILVHTVALQENGTYEIEVEPQGSCNSNASITVTIPSTIPYIIEVDELFEEELTAIMINTSTGIASYDVWFYTPNGYVNVKHGTPSDIKGGRLYRWTSDESYADYISIGSARVDILTTDGCHYTKYISWDFTNGGNKRLSISNEIDVVISPNPAKNILKVYVIDDLGEDEQGICEIYALNGNLVKSANVNRGTNTLDIVNLSKGLYIVRVKYTDKTFEFKQQIK